MDYSLVVGVDSVSNELVLGIVGALLSAFHHGRYRVTLFSDYIRTYTWDKKLESWVKESAFLGGTGKGEPTIVSPRQYRQRFISSMERYFPLVSVAASLEMQRLNYKLFRYPTVGQSRRTLQRTTSKA